MSMIGKTLGHYKIGDQPLSKGGMGEVYRAKVLRLGRDVAIKVLPEEFARDADHPRPHRLRRHRIYADHNNQNWRCLCSAKLGSGVPLHLFP
jgi:serine/threonine protein kinase